MQLNLNDISWSLTWQLLLQSHVLLVCVSVQIAQVIPWWIAGRWGSFVCSLSCPLSRQLTCQNNIDYYQWYELVWSCCVVCVINDNWKNILTRFFMRKKQLYTSTTEKKYQHCCNFFLNSISNIWGSEGFRVNKNRIISHLYQSQGADQKQDSSSGFRMCQKSVL